MVIEGGNLLNRSFTLSLYVRLAVHVSKGCSPESVPVVASLLLRQNGIYYIRTQVFFRFQE